MDKGRWKFCNYNHSGVGFPRECGKTTAVPGQWNSLTRRGKIVSWKTLRTGVMSVLHYRLRDVFSFSVFAYVELITPHTRARMVIPKISTMYMFISHISLRVH